MTKRYGSDVIVELMREAGIEHAAFNPGASFRGIQDSLVHLSDGPHMVLCMHETVAVSVAQGYSRASGRPMAVLLHDVVGLQNASMAIYNAWCDRSPMLLLGGTGPKSKAARRPWIDWIHTANVQANIVRDFVKWDDEPHDLASVPESFARALTATASAPCGPVYVCYDAQLQEDELPAEYVADGISGYAVPTDPAPAETDLDALAAALRDAQRPVIIAGHAGGDATAFAALGELAEVLTAPVFDTGARQALPSSHPLMATGTGSDDLIADADLILALDVDDLRGPLAKRFGSQGELVNLTLLTVGLGHLRLRGWSQDYQALVPSSMHVTGAADITVAGLLRRLARHVAAVPERRTEITTRLAAARASRRAMAAAAEADGAVPLERLIFEVNWALTGLPFTVTNGTTTPLDLGLWALEKPRQNVGWGGGGGLGYGVGGAIGAALANGPDVISVDLQGDGDLLYLPSALWTAAYLQLPVLVIVHNNRQYANTVGHAARLASSRQRDPSRRHVGAGLAEPATDLSGLATAFGVWSAGPISDPETLRSRLREAIQIVHSGRPALLDVHTPSI